MSSEKPDQIQASVAAALSRLRGDLGPSGATAPRIDDKQASERARPANDVRGDPFFRSIQSPPTGMSGGGRAPVPMAPFPRMHAPQEAEPSEPLPAVEADSMSEPASRIEMPEMPEGRDDSDPVSMPEPHLASSEPSEPSPSAFAPEMADAPAAISQPQAPGGNSPLTRVMRGPAASGSADPAQRDLLAGLPPPPISEPLSADTDASGMRRRRRNRRLLAVGAIIVVAGIGAWLWTGSKPTTEVPVIAADATPEKVKPAEEGGLQVQNQDVQVLDPSAQAQSETVLPEPEQPLAPPAAGTSSAEQAPTMVENAASTTGSGAAPEATAAADAPPAPDVPLTSAPLPALEENGSAATTEAASAAPETQATQPAQTPAAPEPAQTQAAVEPASAPEPAPVAKPEAPAAQPAQTQENAATPTVAPAAPAGNVRVQLAAGKSEASVQQEWAALQKSHPDLLGGLSLTVERVDKGGAGIFYRLQVGPLADKDAARKLCASLKSKGQDCIVVAK